MMDASAPDGISHLIDDTLFDGYLRALLQGDRQQCQNIVDKLLYEEIELKDLYTHLFQQSLYKVGELWETNVISVATEHLATAVTDSLLNRLYPKIFSQAEYKKTAVISCCVNEWHQIGGKMVADIFELNGWDTHFLGANTPTADLVRFIDESKPDALGLSLSLYMNINLLLETVYAVRNSFKDLDILCGGQAFLWGGGKRVQQIDNTLHVPSLYALEKTLLT